MGQNKYCLIYCVLRFKTRNSSIVCSNSSNLVIMQIRQRKALLTLFKAISKSKIALKTYLDSQISTFIQEVVLKQIGNVKWWVTFLLSIFKLMFVCFLLIITESAIFGWPIVFWKDKIRISVATLQLVFVPGRLFRLEDDILLWKKDCWKEIGSISVAK